MDIATVLSSLLSKGTYTLACRTVCETSSCIADVERVFRFDTSGSGTAGGKPNRVGFSENTKGFPVHFRTRSDAVRRSSRSSFGPASSNLQTKIPNPSLATDKR
ncbi:hypothetical protein AVEN_135412-1 [Araneus ventricosus]|uniref:Uncharacterized protein n=1 Tax=Araneus ventricosus TaxID=182803 RepID=A0A4Y2QYW4_ARAVE|nr:hypothetical protein AVEN_135412-1 [Araneus ventricosus]